MVVDVDPNCHQINKVYIVDWEIARHGIPGLDVGQFCAKMELFIMFKPQCAQSAKEGTAAFLSAYKEAGSRREDEMAELMRRMIVHIGAHLVAWPSRIHWGTVEDTRRSVKEGVKLLVCGPGSNSEIAQRLVRHIKVDES